MSSELSGGFVLGFRIDPEEKLQMLYKELTSLHEVYTHTPIYGVEYKWSSNKQEIQKNNSFLDDLDAVEEEPRNEISNALMSYLTDGKRADGQPVYSSELGLAIEGIKDGYTLQKLWEVIPQQ